MNDLDSEIGTIRAVLIPPLRAAQPLKSLGPRPLLAAA